MEESQMTDAPTAGQPVAAEKVPGLSRRGLIEVFTKPADFFDKLKDVGKVLAPYLVLVAAGILFFWFLGDLFAQVQLDAIRNSPNFQGQTPPLIAMKISTMVFGTLAIAIAPLIIAGLAMLFGNFVMAGAARFKQVLSVVLYSEMIYVLSFIVTGAMMLARGSLKQSLSLAVLVADRPIDDPVYMIMSKIGVFYIWELVVLGIGFSVLYKFSRNKGFLLSVLSLGLVIALHVVLSVIGKMFQ
jgi:hypothetical protein